MTNLTAAIVTTVPTATKTAIPTTTQNESSSQNISFTTENSTTEVSTSTIQNTTTRITDSTTNITESSYGHEKDNSGDNTGAIVGGILGGVFLAILIVFAVFIIIKRRRKKKQNSGDIRVPPDKEFLDSIHVDRAIKYHKEMQPQEQEDPGSKPYANITRDGETDPQTDPSVGADGYLKKTKNFINLGKNKHKKHKKRGKKKTKATIASDDNHIYTNEIDNKKEPAKRTDSMPPDPAPPPPRNNSEYATGRVAESPVTVDDNKKVSKVATNPKDYVNLPGQKKGEALFGVKPKKSNEMKERKDKKKVADDKYDKPKRVKNEELTKTEAEETEAKLYANLTNDNYYNLKENERQSTYEDVGAKSEGSLQQDDVYENP